MAQYDPRRHGKLEPWWPQGFVSRTLAGVGALVLLLLAAFFWPEVSPLASGLPWYLRVARGLEGAAGSATALVLLLLFAFLAGLALPGRWRRFIPLPARLGRLAALLLLLLLVLSYLLGASPAGAAQAGYCLSCHLDYQPRSLGSLSWRGPVQVDSLSPCPAVRRAKEGLFVLESRLSLLRDHLHRERLRHRSVSYLLGRWRQVARAHRELLSRPLYAIEDMSRELAALERRLQERVGRPLRRLESNRRQGLFWGMLLVLALVLGALPLWAWKRGQDRPGPDPLAWVAEGRLPGRGEEG